MTGDKGATDIIVAPSADGCPAYRLMCTAYHEAGHAVAAYACWPQQPVALATIIPSDGLLGRVQHVLQGDEWREQFGDGWREELEDVHRAELMAVEAETISWLAGYLAEAKFRGGLAAMPYAFDYTPDSWGARDAASSSWDGETKERCHASAYCCRTEQLLAQPEVWLAITRVACALLRHRELSGGEIEAIVAEAGVKPDPWREPLFYEDEDDEFDDEAFSWSRW